MMLVAWRMVMRLLPCGCLLGFVAEPRSVAGRETNRAVGIQPCSGLVGAAGRKQSSLPPPKTTRKTQPKNGPQFSALTKPQTEQALRFVAEIERNALVIDAAQLRKSRLAAASRLIDSPTSLQSLTSEALVGRRLELGLF